MKYHNLICGIVLIISVIFWAIPQQIFATDIDYQTISTWESKKIIKSASFEIYKKWEIKKTSGYLNASEMTTLSFVKEILLSDVYDYTLNNLPVDISINLVTQAFDISKLIIAGDVSGMIGKVEKETVKIAVNYLIDYFNKDKIKVSFGGINFKRDDSYGKTDTTIQYIILLKDINKNKSKIVMRIYSPNPIHYIRGKSGYSTGGFVNEMSVGESIPPFVMEINGEIRKTDLGEYTWDENPNIEVAFPNNVPDFNLRPPSFFEKYIINPIQEKLSDLADILDVFGANSEFIEIISSGEEDEDAINSQLIEMGAEEETSVVCLKSESTKPLHEVIINEVAWMGTKDSANNEWIELKNVSGKDISLRGWKLVDKASQIDITFGDIIMRKDSILLLERGNDNVVSSKKADLIYNGALSNTDEKLYLFNSNCSLEDYVSAESKWPAGDNSAKRTMERGSDLSWHEYFGDGYNNIWGTPREENSIEVIKEVIKEEEKEIEKVEEVEEIKEKEVIEEEIKEITYCSQIGIPNHKDIIINEVAWMGTQDSANNEWIELRNLSSSTINLNGWQLLDKGNQIKIVFDENDIILPNQFYLLERGGDNVIPSVVADKIYSGALSNTNESLRLFDSNCNLVDEALAEPNWPAGDNINKKTMERNNDLSWYSQSNSGTPKSNNSYFVQSYTGGGSESVVTAPQEVEEITYCSQTGIPNHKDIIINEVAWMGDDISFSNEWIELKNISEEEINLEGWQLLSKDNKIKIVFDENDIILPNQFYLLKRGDDESDKKYSGALSNTNESLRLFDNNCNLIDEVLAEPSWPAGDNDTKKTMERGSDLSWHTYFGEFLGTPKAENSIQEEIIDDVIEEDNINDFLVISEIQTNGIDGLEYVELFNQSDEEIELCNEESCYYLAYFSTSKDEEGNYNYDWNNPYYKWDFPLGETIPPKSYYLILIRGDIENNFVVLKQDGLPYSSQLLSNSDGSVGIFLNVSLEEELTVELAKQLKVDVVGWGDNDFQVKEEKSLDVGDVGESFGRKLDEGKYRDTDNNFNDFELQKQSPGEKAKYSPQRIENIEITGIGNSITLTWASPEDQDSLPEEINYEIYYSIINNENFNLLDSPIIEIINGLNTLTIDSLYYDKDYFFTIKAIDIDNNESELSEEFPFRTFASDHKISSIYQKTNLSRVIGDFSSETIIMEKNSELMSFSFLIDGNERTYFNARVSGSRYVFSTEGSEIIWKYKCDNYCEIILLGKDGTIYLSDTYSIKALSPKGELKWEKDGLGEISNDNFAIDSMGRIYFITHSSSNYTIYAIEDNFYEPVIRTVYNFLPQENSSNLVIDNKDNLYFSIGNRLLKTNISGNTSEKIIDVEYHDDYLEEKDKIAWIREINITPDDKILINIDRQYFDENNKSYGSMILLSENMNDIIWKKISNAVVLNIDANQIYLWKNDSISDTAFMTFCLYGLNVEDGSVLWRKKWSSNISMRHVNQLITDNNGNVYFSRGSSFMGYNTNNITSEKPEDDLILNKSLGSTIYSFSAIDSKILFSIPKKIVMEEY